TAPHRVHLGQVAVVPPVAGVDQRQQPRPVGAGLGAEDAGGGAPPVAVGGPVLQGVGAQVVAVGGFGQLGHGPDRVIQQGDDVGEGVAEETGDAQGDVDAG